MCVSSRVRVGCTMFCTPPLDCKQCCLSSQHCILRTFLEPTAPQSTTWNALLDLCNVICTATQLMCTLYMYMNPNAEVSFTPPWNLIFLGFHYGSSSAGQLCDHQFSVFGAFLRVKTVLLQTIGTGAAWWVSSPPSDTLLWCLLPCCLSEFLKSRAIIGFCFFLMTPWAIVNISPKVWIWSLWLSTAHVALCPLFWRFLWHALIWDGALWLHFSKRSTKLPNQFCHLLELVKIKKTHHGSGSLSDSASWRCFSSSPRPWCGDSSSSLRLRVSAITSAMRSRSWGLQLV